MVSYGTPRELTLLRAVWYRFRPQTARLYGGLFDVGRIGAQRSSQPAAGRRPGVVRAALIPHRRLDRDPGQARLRGGDAVGRAGEVGRGTRGQQRPVDLYRPDPEAARHLPDRVERALVVPR